MMAFAMPHGFDAYRIFISAPGDLSSDRQSCHDVIASVNESTTMPEKVLLVAVGLRDNDEISSYRAIVSDNIRWSSYFLQLFQDDWGPRDLFRKLFLLAIECREDAQMPMRDVVVFLKDSPHETSPEILAFRAELTARTDLRVVPYRSVEELNSLVTEICKEWGRVSIEAARSARPADNA
jgi:hypothetical protein